MKILSIYKPHTQNTFHVISTSLITQQLRAQKSKEDDEFFSDERWTFLLLFLLEYFIVVTKILWRSQMLLKNSLKLTSSPFFTFSLGVYSSTCASTSFVEQLEQSWRKSISTLLSFLIYLHIFFMLLHELIRFHEVIYTVNEHWKLSIRRFSTPERWNVS